MNSTQLSKEPLRRLALDPICSLGKWLFVPDRMNAVGDVRVGYLSCNGEQVVLQHCSELLADLVRTIRQLDYSFAMCYLDEPSEGDDTSPAKAAVNADWKTLRLLTHPDEQTEQDGLHLKELRERYPELATTADLVAGFARVLVSRLGADEIDSWIATAKNSGIAEVVSFADGLTLDLAAVHAGVTLGRSSGRRTTRRGASIRLDPGEAARLVSSLLSPGACHCELPGSTVVSSGRQGRAGVRCPWTDGDGCGLASGASALRSSHE